MQTKLTDLFLQRAHPAYGGARESYFMAAPKQDADEDDDLFFDIDDDADIDVGMMRKQQEEFMRNYLQEKNAVLNKNKVRQEQPVEDQQEEVTSAQPVSGGKVKEGDLLLVAKGLTKQYKQGGNVLNILNNVDLRLYAGEIAALVGPSGSGKSSLLHILGLLDAPTSGQIMMGDKDISKLSEGSRTKLRNGHIGFVYQFHHLLPEFSAIENVALPLIIAGKKTSEAHKKAIDLLVQLGLEHRLKHRPATMSGGEQQRVAIARALVNDPYLLFADEPTGNLDPHTSEEVFELLLKQVRGRGIAALIATHNMELAGQMDRILEVKSGRILPY